jgi:hypothetical protein
VISEHRANETHAVNAKTLSKRVAYDRLILRCIKGGGETLDFVFVYQRYCALENQLSIICRPAGEPAVLAEIFHVQRRFQAELMKHRSPGRIKPKEMRFVHLQAADYCLRSSAVCCAFVEITIMAFRSGWFE